MKDRYDAIVLGAGSSGAGAAWQLARRGLRVALVERRPRHTAGARWTNGLPAWIFDEAGLTRPDGDEVVDRGLRTIMLSSSGREAARMDPSPMWNVRMDRLVERLQRLGLEAGVEILDGARLLELEERSGRLTAVSLSRIGRRLRLQADLFVDATGVAGVLGLRLPGLRPWTPRLAPGEVCSAGQAVYEIGNPEQAREWLAYRGREPGDALNWIGVHDAFSTLIVAVEHDMETAHLVTGNRMGTGGPTGSDMLRQAEQVLPWMGRRVSGGLGLIPLRAPLDRLGGAGVARLGDAGHMVYTAHGSGVGMGLLAGALLAEEVCRHRDPGGGAALHAWQRRFQRTWGGTLAAADLVRRATCRLSGRDLNHLMDAGLLTDELYRSSINQELPRPLPGELLDQLGGLARNHPLLFPLAGTVLRLPALLRHYQRYPAAGDEATLCRWSRLRSRISSIV